MENEVIWRLSDSNPENNKQINELTNQVILS